MNFMNAARVLRRCGTTPSLFRAVRSIVTITDGSSLAVEELRIPVPWGHLAAKAWGPDNGTPMLAIHGQLDNAGSFDSLAPLLVQASIRLICLELADHGMSSHTPPGLINMDYLAHAYQVQRAVDYLGWNKVNLLGHSLGSLPAMFWASSNPQRMESLINLDLLRPPPYSPTEFANQVAKSMTNICRVTAEPSRQTVKRMTYQEARNKLLKRYAEVGYNIEERDADILLRRGLRKVGHEGGQPLYEYSWDPRASLRLYLLTDGQFQSVVKGIKCPVLLVQADQGLRWPEDSKEAVRYYLDSVYGLNKHFRLVCLPGRHHVHLTHPERVAPHVLDFLNACPSSIESKLSVVI